MNQLFTGSGSVRMVKNCDLGYENAALGLRPRAAFYKTSVTVFHYTSRQSEAFLADLPLALDALMLFKREPARSLFTFSND